jgi:heme/copper-type cytochrome/quinol oxidase subunit 4
MHEEDKEVRGLSQVAKYTITAVILGLITAVEVLVLYPPLMEAGDSFKIALLGVLSISKFIIVVALFMHLWHDSPLFTGIFTLGMIIGAGTLVGLLALFSYYPLPENAVKAPPLEEIYKERKLRNSEGADFEGDHSYRMPPPMELRASV